jgi:hypothetical protein
VLGPRGPHLPDGPCPAWPEVSPGRDAAGDQTRAGPESVDALLDALAAAGIYLIRDGDSLVADVEDRADLVPYHQRIQEHKTELLDALELRERIVAAAAADPRDFDHGEYDRLWEL